MQAPDDFPKREKCPHCNQIFPPLTVGDMLRRQAARPKREPEPGERVGLSLRVTPEIRTRLVAAHQASGRSLSQEAEFRLERSFDREDLLIDVLTLAFGSKVVAGFFLLITHAMVAAASTPNQAVDSTFDQRSTWLDDSAAFDRAATAAMIVLHQLHPTGLGTDFAKDGEANIAWDIVSAVRSKENVKGIDAEVIERVRALLGPLASREHKMPAGRTAEILRFARRSEANS